MLSFVGTFLLVVLMLSSVAPTPTVADSRRAITALGRLEPGDGVIRVAGPSGPAPVVAELRVAEGDQLEKGQIIAVLDTFASREAELARLDAELEDAGRRRGRVEALAQRKAASQAQLDTARLAEQVAAARSQAARAELDLSLVRAPVAGRVLDVRARNGERLGPEGLVELGETARMYAVAEVYETDIGRVREGQYARISSDAFQEPLTGRVEIIGLKVGKLDVLGSDPVARTDARVVEVRIRLEPGAAAAGLERLTNLQVEVEIEADPDEGLPRGSAR